MEAKVGKIEKTNSQLGKESEKNYCSGEVEC